MKKELFFEEIRKWVTEYYGEKAKVSLHEVSKNNNSKKHGLCVTYTTSNCGPTVYLEDFYEEYERGMTIKEVFEEILNIIEGHAVHEKVDLSFFCDFDNVRPNVCFKLISATKNKEMLEEMPHRLISDLAVVYFVSLSDRGIDGTITIKQQHADMWGVSEEDLFEAALDNTPRKYPADCQPITKFITEMIPAPCEDMHDLGIIVATNIKHFHGAGIILYPGFLEEVYERFNCGLYIIPSSVHEVIIAPEYLLGDPEWIIKMVEEVNEVCVSSEEYLADGVYYYDLRSENTVKKVELGNGAMVL